MREERGDFCFYPGLNDFRCGDQNTYRIGCSDRKCKEAWALYCQGRRSQKLSNSKISKVWQFPHGTTENYRETCRCRLCCKAWEIDGSIRLAEDWCFRHEPNRISSTELREPHGFGRTGYVKKCRCPECRIANRLDQARRRGSAKVRQILLERDALRVERQAVVSDYLDWLGKPSYDDLDTLPDQAAERNAREATARLWGYTTLEDAPPVPSLSPADADPDSLVAESLRINRDLDLQQVEAKVWKGNGA